MEKDRKTSREGDEERYDLEILLRRPSLRTNIPRRISQVCPPTEETSCGVGYLRGRWLQSFANRNSYLFIYGVLGSFYGSYYAYFYGSVSSLEKRFRISSQTIGMIASTGDITMAVTCFFLSFCVPKTHKPRVIGIGIFLIIASTIVFSLPHFLTLPKNMGVTTRDYSSYLKNETEFGHCNDKTCSEESGHILLYASQVLHGIGGSLFFTAGKSYKDENIEKHQPPALLSLLVVLKILGPAFGYWLSSMFLKIFEYPELMPIVTEEEPQWVGAWWLGSLVIGFMFIIPAFLVSLFPTILPKTAFRRMHNQIKGLAELRGKILHRKGFKRLFFNPAFACTHFTTIFNIMGFMIYYIYLPKYVEIQYQIPASNANLIAGTIVLICSAAGIVIANSVITRYRPSARILASWTVFVGILSMGGLISYIYLGCQASDDKALVMVAQNLNSTCQCVNTPYFPVCDQHSQSFTSPCHAGCGNILYINYMQGYETCNHPQSSSPRKVFKGFCSSNCQSEFLKFILVTCSITFIYATGRTSNYWFRTNYKNQEKLLILSSGMSFVGLLATIPAPITFGYLLDESCIFWDENCDKTGNCWLYDNNKMRLVMNLSAVGYSLIGVIYDLCIWYYVKNLELFDDFYYDFDENDEK